MLPQKGHGNLSALKGADMGPNFPQRALLISAEQQQFTGNF